MKNIVSNTQQRIRSVSSSNSSNNSSNTSSVRATGAALLAIGVYVASNLERCDVGFCAGSVQLHGVETVPLAACPVVVPKKTKKTKEGKDGSTKRTIEDLMMQHNELGFSAAEIIETVARPLEAVWSEHRANVTSCEFPSFKASVLNASNLSQPLGYTLPDSFSNFSLSNFSHSILANAANATTTFLNTTSFAAHATRSIVSCSSITLTNVLETRSAKTKRHTALKAVFHSRLDKKLGGAVRFATNDSVAKMTEIFSHCPATPPSFGGGALQKQVAAKFPVQMSHMKALGAGKKIFTTKVADNWQMEARVVNGLWTDVVVSRGGFVLSLTRDKVGLVWASVEGKVLGEL